MTADPENPPSPADTAATPRNGRHGGASHSARTSVRRGQPHRQPARSSHDHGARRRLWRYRHEPAVCAARMLQARVRHLRDAGERLRRALADRVVAHACRERQIHRVRDARGQSRRRRHSRHARADHRASRRCHQHRRRSSSRSGSSARHCSMATASSRRRSPCSARWKDSTSCRLRSVTSSFR